MDPTTPPSEPGEGRVRLSTGELVELPLRTRGTITGAAFSASRERAAELLPDSLGPVPIPLRTDRTAVAFFSVDYDRVGRGEIEPYDEFGVVLPATPAESGDASTRSDPSRPHLPFVPDLPFFSTIRALADSPLATALAGDVGGYAWYLPVTTDSARALGEEIWGYPKEVADVSFADDGRTRRTTVAADGDRVLTLDVRRPPSANASVSTHSYTVAGGTLLREPLELTGTIGAWPVSSGASYALGDHPRADRLRGLDLGSRALALFSADAAFVIHRGEAVETR